MRPALLAVLLAVPAGAQDPSTSTVSASTDTVSASTSAVSASTSAASMDDVAGHGFKVGGGEAPKAKLSRPMHAVVHKEAADWEPVGLRVGGVPGSAENAASLKVVKVKGRMKGENTKAKSAARAHKGAKNSRWLVISLYPKALERKRTHFELRFRVVEGFVENVEVAAVTVTDRRIPPSPKLLDSYDLREEGVEYQEERPGSGQLVVAEFDPRPSGTAANSGRLEKAEFTTKELGFVNLSWSAKGVRTAAK